MADPIRCLTENSGLAFVGDRAGGRFGVTGAEARRLLTARNPHGKPNADVIRPSVGSDDLRGRPRQRWTIDFPPDMEEREAALYERPYARIRRLATSTGRRRWWIHRSPQAAMRIALARRDRFLATPAVARHPVFTWLPPEVLPDHTLVVFARDDDWFFGVLQSHIHRAWIRHLGRKPGGSRAGIRYSPTICFATFPLPWPPPTPLGRLTRQQEDLRTGVARAARTLDAARNEWTGDCADRSHTLAGLYELRPWWLRDHHAALDDAVAAAYGWPADLGDDDIINRLLVLNGTRVGAAASACSQPV